MRVCLKDHCVLTDCIMHGHKWRQVTCRHMPHSPTSSSCAPCTSSASYRLPRNVTDNRVHMNGDEQTPYGAANNTDCFALPPARLRMAATPRASMCTSVSSLLSLSLTAISVLVTLTPVMADSLFRSPYRQSDQSSVLKLGVILPYSPEHPFNMKKVYPAIQIAAEKILQDPYFLSNVREIVLNEADSNCSQTDGPLAAIDMFLGQNAHVFFGPTCDFVVGHVALYSVSWNIPVISTGALSYELDDKNEFPVLTRMQSTYSEFAKVFERIMDRFKWKNVGFLYASRCYNNLYPVFKMVTNKSKIIVYNRRFYEPITAEVIESKYLLDAPKEVRSKYFILALVVSVSFLCSFYFIGVSVSILFRISDTALDKCDGLFLSNLMKQ